MTSEIRTNSIKSRTGLSTVSYADTGIIVSGIVTATQFKGDGSQLTGVTGTTINNNANNRIITGSGTANTLEAETTLEWDGTNTLTSVNQGSGYPDFRVNLKTVAGGGSFEAFRADGNGRFRIGSQSTTANSSADELLIGNGSNNRGLTIFGGTSNIYFGDSSDNDIGKLEYNHSDDSMRFTTNTSEKLRIDSSGKLLVGTTVAGSSGADNLVLYRNGNGGITVRNNANQNGNLFFSRGTSGADEYRGYIQYQHAQDLMVFGCNGGERVRITSGGQFLIGTTTAVRALTIKDPGQIHVESTSTGNWVGMSIKGSSGTNNYNAYFGVLDSNGKFFIDNSSNGADIEIESGASGQKAGRVLVGPSVPTSGDDSQVIIRNNPSNGIYRCLRLNNDSNNNRITMTFEGNGTATGDIRLNGSTTSYNSYSDYRLKENVVPLTDPVTRLKTLKPYRFNFIASPEITLDGFFAHEVSPAVAEAVGGEKDDVDNDGNVIPQALDMAKLVPLLTASLQEAITKIETLEQENIALRARVTNLEGN